MAGSYERYEIIGNLGRDPELRYTQSGTPVASFSVAITETWKDKATGEQREKTKWVRCTAWNKLGEVCHKFLSKGSSVFCTGTVEASAYLDKEGNPQSSTEMTVREVQFLDKRSDSQQSQRNEEPSPTGSSLDDIPFDYS